MLKWGGCHAFRFCNHTCQKLASKDANDDLGFSLQVHHKDPCLLLGKCADWLSGVKKEAAEAEEVFQMMVEFLNKQCQRSHHYLDLKDELLLQCMLASSAAARDETLTKTTCISKRI